MKDALIGLGVLAFIGLFVYALVSTARKQRRATTDAFREVANERGLQYEAEDRGAAQEFARDLDAIGQFSSPSLGAVIPEDVVTGTVRDRPVVLFRHHTRFYEGCSREWFVAGVVARAPIADRCAVEFSRDRAPAGSMYLRDPIVKDARAGVFRVLVRAPDESSAGVLMDDGVLDRLARLASDLSFRPEIQIRADRVAIYPADRNASLDGARMLQELLDSSIRIIELSGAARHGKAA